LSRPEIAPSSRGIGRTEAPTISTADNVPYAYTW
jgi:hypothetical protein